MYIDNKENLAFNVFSTSSVTRSGYDAIDTLGVDSKNYDSVMHCLTFPSMSGITGSVYVQALESTDNSTFTVVSEQSYLHGDFATASKNILGGFTNRTNPYSLQYEYIGPNRYSALRISGSGEYAVSPVVTRILTNPHFHLL